MTLRTGSGWEDSWEVCKDEGNRSGLWATATHLASYVWFSSCKVLQRPPAIPFTYTTKRYTWQTFSPYKFRSWSKYHSPSAGDHIVVEIHPANCILLSTVRNISNIRQIKGNHSLLRSLKNYREKVWLPPMWLTPPHGSTISSEVYKFTVFLKWGYGHSNPADMKTNLVT